MAVATVTPTIFPFPGGIDNSQRVIYVYGTVAVQASPATYATSAGVGLPIVWTGLLQQVSNLPLETQGSNVNPVAVYFTSAGTSGTTVGGFGYAWNKATNGFQILAASAGLAGTATTEEFPASTAIPASVSGDTILFEAIFIRNLG